MSNCKIIAICNQKGGVTKTTTTANLGIGLAMQGKSVLLIDNDPQSDLTTSLRGRPLRRLRTQLSGLWRCCGKGSVTATQDKSSLQGGIGIILWLQTAAPQRPPPFTHPFINPQSTLTHKWISAHINNRLNNVKNENSHICRFRKQALF